MAAAINALIKQAVRQQYLAFSARDENGLTQEEAAELRRRVAEVNAGRYITRELIEDEKSEAS